MPTIQLISKVYDLETREFVKRTTEFPISKETLESLQKDLSSAMSNTTLHISGHGTLDSHLNDLELQSPIANENRFHIDTPLLLLDDNLEVVGGFQNF